MPRSKKTAPENNADTSVFVYRAGAALRRGPTIVVVGESRDEATVQGTVETALAGHLAYSAPRGPQFGRRPQASQRER
jgi:Tfp pilus assembly pilus retraction ATPase PilT